MGNTCLDLKKMRVNERIDYGSNKIKEFSFVRALKRNPMSSVWQVKNQKSKTVHALKVTKKVQVYRKNCLHLPVNEQAILMSLESPFIVNMIESFQDKCKLYILLQYMAYGSLRDYIKFSGYLTQDQARFVIVCLLLSLQYLHEQGIAHLDLKPENLLIDECGYFRLCDFNLSYTFKKQVQTSKLVGVGTYGYQAPEILRDVTKIGPEADLYSMGVVCVEMLTGISKRNAQEFSVTYLKNLIKERVNISNQCLDFILKLLQDDPWDRLGAGSAFQDIWRHPWLVMPSDQKHKYMQKSIPSFISDNYRKHIDNPEDSSTSSEGFSSDSQQDLYVERLILEARDFQRSFSGFQTVIYQPQVRK